MQKALDHPVIGYLIVSLCSLTVAVMCFRLGGSLAEISGKDNTFLGFGFKASGAIGGFAIVFVLSLKAIEKLKDIEKQKPQEIPLRIKVHLIGKPQNFSLQHTYSCEAVVFNSETGERQSYKIEPRWEAGLLTLDLRNLRAGDYVGAKITDAQNRTWILQDFQPLTSVREIDSF
jgi:hypothetical protein